ncbi:MAG: hypothetical protein M4579_003255 [Chaenotheca gracillima]|nr:MAG: hypothetical protein M4579_003255 [Chaenotheca gracillima]
MSTFKALNISDDEDSDDEVDDTKEIQIEEALKLYQNAIKLHSQGPRYFKEASEAYDELFASDIFKYPESAPEFGNGDIPGYDHDHDIDPHLEDQTQNGLVRPNFDARSGSDNIPSTLLRILYLSFKNRGQLTLDYLRCQKREEAINGVVAEPPPDLSDEEVVRSSTSALVSFAEALARDEKDSELWRRAARIAASLGSKRMMRYCLEAVVDVGNDGMPVRPDQVGLEEAFAGFQLTELLHILNDKIPLSRPPLSTLSTKKLNPLMKGLLDPFPYLPPAPQDRGSLASDYFRSLSPYKFSFIEASTTWAALGKAILQHLPFQSRGGVKAGAPIFLHLEGAKQSIDAEVSTIEDRSKSSEQDSRGGSILLERSMTQKQQEPQSTGPKTSQNGADVGNGAVNPSLDSHNSGLPADRSKIATPLPVRKRSSSSAGLQDPVDSNSRIRSKRIKARESIAEADPATKSAFEMAKASEESQQRFAEVDHNLFETANYLLFRLGLYDLGDPTTLRSITVDANNSMDMGTSESFGQENSDYFVRDMYVAVKQWDEEKGRMFLHGDGVDASASSNDTGGSISSPNAGITAFLEHSRTGMAMASSKPSMSKDDGLLKFVEEVHKRQLTLPMIGVRWLESLLLPNLDLETPTAADSGRFSAESSYLRHTWSEPLKEAVVQLLIGLDEIVFFQVQESVAIVLASRASRHLDQGLDRSMVELAQTVFELHLDIYASITNPSSEVDIETRVTQKDRLGRWATIAHDLMNILAESHTPDQLIYRFLWASAIYASLREDAHREHIVLCMEDLQTILKEHGNRTVTLPNNAIMPDISVNAATREISRLTTMDFFLQIFQNQEDEPLAVIEALEPVLDSQAVQEGSAGGDNEELSGFPETSQTTWAQPSTPDSHQSEPSLKLAEMRKFLESGTASLRLFLWRKLRDAYESIDYTPKVMSCYLRSIEIVVSEFESPSYLESLSSQRHLLLMKWLHVLDDLITKALSIYSRNAAAFECVDQEHLTRSLVSVTRLFKLLYGFVLYEDLVRAGQIQFEPVSRPALTAFVNVAQRIRDLQIRTWTLFYALIKEGLMQNEEDDSFRSEAVADLLRSMHHAAGIRLSCSSSNNMFLHLMRKELVQRENVVGREHDLIQVLFDLYGLRLGAGLCEDHGCTSEILDRRAAIQIADFVMQIVRNVNIKELPKTEYKSTVDKMQQSIGAPKATGPRLHNQRIVDAYLKTSIDPKDLYKCFKGQLQLSTIPVSGDLASIVGKGWYFLLGHMALTRFRSLKRVSSGPTDDLNIACTFFKLELEFTVDQWETWYRLAQTYDTLLEDAVSWSADKLNNDYPELFTLQRNAIHCYAMAVSTAVRLSDRSAETSSKLSDLFTDFGCRIYATSRPPFGLETFMHDNRNRFFTGVDGMYRKPGHTHFSEYKAWHFAIVLFAKALKEKSYHWVNHYMLGKCLWKILQHRDNDKATARSVAIPDVLDAFKDAIKTLPKRRSDKQEPILEPHYKLASVVHKLVENFGLDIEAAKRHLSSTPYSRNASAEPENEWEPYILRVLKNLRTADKANWHHRMIVRAARIHFSAFEANKEDSAILAKNELTQQIFTKTLTIQVWKPENERAGRHFWYTSDYTRFFSSILASLDDRASIEALAKRVRKRTSEFYRHAKVWSEVCLQYLKILRRVGNIPEGHEEAVFKSANNEDFQSRSARLESWCHIADTSNPTLSVLREIIELKRLNNNLMKSTLLDDLTTDTYALLYEQMAAELAQKATYEQDEKREEEKRDMMSLKNLLMSTDGGGAEASSTSQNPPEPAPTTVVRRVKGVGRREILRKAEAAVTKPSTTPAASSRSVPRQSTETSAKAAASHPDQTASRQPKSPSGKEDTGTGVESSIAGSVHDSADDESDDSAPDEVFKGAISKPMFPNLGHKNGENSRSAAKDHEGTVHDDVEMRDGSG